MLLYLQVVINTTHSWTMASMVLMAMDPVDEDLVLDTEDEAIFLANMGVARQAVHGLIDGVVGRGVVCHVDAEGRVPSGELGPMNIVGGVEVVRIQSSVLQYSDIPVFKPQMKTLFELLLAAHNSITESSQLMK